MNPRGYQPERRANTRKACRLAITCRPFTKPTGDDFAATARNISTSGISILANQPVTAHTLLVYLRNVPGTFSLSKLVRVKTLDTDESAHCQLGCVFVKKLTPYELAWLLEKN
jgi:hypothetical protein